MFIQPTPTSSGEYKCTISGEKSDDSYKLSEHKKSHASRYQCGLCLKVFKSQGGIDSHMHTHAQSRPLKCSVCEKGFSRKGNRDKHKFIHSKERNAVKFAKLLSKQRQIFECICKYTTIQNIVAKYATRNVQSSR